MHSEESGTGPDRHKRVAEGEHKGWTCQPRFKLLLTSYLCCAPMDWQGAFKMGNELATLPVS
jgi:hypothetical protein